MSDFGACRACRQVVVWAPSAATRTPMPLEESPDNGNVVLDGFGIAHVFRDHAAAEQAMDEDDRFPIGQTYLSHHATCPEAERFRSRPSKAVAKAKPAAPSEEPLF